MAKRRCEAPENARQAGVLPPCRAREGDTPKPREAVSKRPRGVGIAKGKRGQVESASFIFMIMASIQKVTVH